MMLRSLCPKLLLLALGFPGASWALGLGEIHVESALHQPLAAKIDIVGASAENLAGLSASVADEEIFQRYGLERPSILSTAELTVRMESDGRAVVVIRSTAVLKEPMITFLVDLHSPNGELVREYTVLLDPPDLLPAHVGGVQVAAVQAPASTGSEAQSAETTTAAAVAASASQEQAPASSGRTSYTVARRDTLDRIARIAGAHSRAERRRMMVAIFRANPSAFQTNINVLRTGVTLRFPSAEELAALSPGEANSEFDAQMAAWRGSERHSQPVVAKAVSPAAATVADQSAATNTNTSADTDTQNMTAAALKLRVESLEKSLSEIRRDLKQPLVVPAASAAATGTATAAASTNAPVATPAPSLAEPSAPASNANSTLTPAPNASSTPTPASTAGSTLSPASSASSTPTSAAADSTQSPTAKPATVQVTRPKAAAPVDTSTDDSVADDEPAPAPSRGWRFAPLVAAVGLALAITLALALVARAWFIRRGEFGNDRYSELPAEHQAYPSRLDITDVPVVKLGGEPTAPPFPQIDMSASYLVEEMKHDAEHASTTPAAPESPQPEVSASATGSNTIGPLPIDPGLPIDPTMPMKPMDFEPTVKMPVASRELGDTTSILSPPVELSVDDTAAREFAFFNPESTVNTTHVTLSSGLDQQPQAFVERRKNPVDVLRQAIEREPDRSDLRLKLLELYYTNAAQNQRAFLEVARQLAKNEKIASAKDWSQIADMGRAIAPEDELFSNGGDDVGSKVA